LRNINILLFYCFSDNYVLLKKQSPKLIVFSKNAIKGLVF